VTRATAFVSALMMPKTTKQKAGEEDRKSLGLLTHSILPANRPQPLDMSLIDL
jgi:hypothetical protein